MTDWGCDWECAHSDIFPNTFWLLRNLSLVDEGSRRHFLWIHCGIFWIVFEIGTSQLKKKKKSPLKTHRTRSLNKILIDVSHCYHGTKGFQSLKHVRTSVLSFYTQRRKSKTSRETLFWRDASPDPCSEEFHMVQISSWKRPWTVLSLANRILNFTFFNLNSAKRLTTCLIRTNSGLQNHAFPQSPGVCSFVNKDWELK